MSRFYKISDNHIIDLGKLIEITRHHKVLFFYTVSTEYPQIQQEFPTEEEAQKTFKWLSGQLCCW